MIHKHFISLIFLTIGSMMSYGQEYRISYQCIAWHPHADQILFTAMKVKKDWSDYSPDKWHLYLYDLQSKKLTDLGNSILYFSVHPDGKQIVYDRDTETGKELVISNLETGKSRALVINPDKYSGPDWSSDGKHIVFYSKRDGNEELYSIEVVSGQTRQLTMRDSDKSYNPQWSPNSNRIVYYLEKGDGKDQIYITDSTGSFQTNLTNDDHHNIFPSWTPDGRILYTRDEGEVMIMNADGSRKESFLRDLRVNLIKLDKSGSKALVTDSNSNLSILNIEDLSKEVIISITSFQ